MTFPNPSDAARTAAAYAKDLAERVLVTFVGAVAAVLLAAGPADMLSATFWESVGVAGFAAVASLVKGIVARVVGDRNSAALTK